MRVRREGMRRCDAALTVAVLVASVALTGCGTNPDDEANLAAEGLYGTIGEDPSETVGTTVAAGAVEAEQATSLTSPAAPSATEPDAPLYRPARSAEGLRVAPRGAEPIVALSWGSDGVSVLNHEGEPRLAIEGPVANVADTGTGLVFQRPEGRDDAPGNVLWFGGASGPREIVNIDAAESLHLIGAVPASESGEPTSALVFYTRRGGNRSASATTLLWSMDPISGERIEIAEVGGLQWSIDISDVHGAYPDAAGIWRSEDQAAIVVLDLRTGEETERISLSSPASAEYIKVVLVGRVVYGLRSESTKPEVAYGLYRLNPVSGRETLAASFAQGDADWVPVTMFASGRDRVVISAADMNGRPLPAIVVHTASGEASSMAEAGFVGPQFLS